MAFNDIKTIESPKFYSDLAFRKSREKTQQISKSILRNKTKEERLKIVYEKQIAIFTDVIHSRLLQIIETFPKTTQLNGYYKELFCLYIDLVDYKKTLYKIKWSSEKLEEFKRDYLKNIKRSKFDKHIKKLKGEFEGRVNSILKKLNTEFKFLRECRKVFLSLPRIKDIATIIIGGFPNVGKSTVLAKLSSSKPEISNYPFTTKNLNIGYTENKIQLIDTPGTLNRKDVMNNIEYQAYLTAKYFGETLLFVFDSTETYNLEDQIKLFKRFKREYIKPNSEIIIYLSKTDLIDEKKKKEVIEEIKKATKEKKILTSIKVLKKHPLISS